jgi:hypothetical protein
MPLQVKPSSLFGYLSIGALVLAIFWISLISHPTEFSLGELGAVLKLVFAGIAFSAIGHGVISATALNRREPINLPALSQDLAALAIGQISLMTYLLIRSAVSGGVYYFFGLQAPVTTIEISALGLLGIWLISQRATHLAINRPSPSRVINLIAVLICCLGPVVLRELPRTLPLSSDPDQHTFWASQIVRLGIIPWDQGILGIGSFGYPAGFAALNSIWISFSGLSAVEIVTMQPQIQFLLALLLCAAAAQILMPKISIQKAHVSSSTQLPQSNSDSSVLFTALGLILIYWLVLPYGLQNERIHGEGTARLSCSLLVAVITLIWVSSAHYIRSYHALFFLGLTALVSLALITTINPISAVGSIFLTSIIVIRALGIGLKRAGFTLCAVSCLVAIFILCVILAGDPYIFKIALNSLMSILNKAQPSQAAIDSGAVRMALDSHAALKWLRPAELYSLLFSGTEQLKSLVSWRLALVTVAFTIWLLTSVRTAVRWFIALVICSFTSWLSSSLHGGGDAISAAYLIKPYINEAALQNGAILLFIALTPPLYLIGRYLGSRAASSIVLVLVAVGVFRPPSHRDNDQSAFNLTPRECGTKNSNCLSVAETLALDFLSRHTNEIRARYPHLTYATAPKVLILGSPVTRGPERWVFSSGLARVAPNYSALPVAFFYGRGSPDWNYENYQARVCKNLDLDWLKRRNVRFILVGKREPGCMRRKREIIKGLTTLFEMDGVRVLAGLQR